MDDSEQVTLLLEGGHEVAGLVTQKQLNAIYEALSLSPDHVRGVVRVDEYAAYPYTDDSVGSEIAIQLRRIIAVRTYKTATEA